MKIVFDDIVYSLQKAGGISELFSQVCKYLSGDISHLIYSNATNNFVFSRIPGQHYIESSSFCLSIKRYLNLNIKSDTPYIFHSTYYRISNARNAINITTVHDFMYEIYRHDLKSIFHKIQKKKAVFKSDGVICISENTKNDLQKYYPKYNRPIVVIPNGYDDSTYFFKGGFRKKQIVYTGGRIGYKSFPLAVAIAREMKDYQFIIVGGGELSPQEKELLSGVNYTKYGFMSSEDLCELYNTSFILLYTSEYEGFGITPIEAQACGCVVACQKKASLCEVVMESAITIDARNIHETVDCIRSCEMPEIYEQYQKKGFENIKRFSWKKTAEKYSAFYKEIASRKGLF